MNEISQGAFGILDNNYSLDEKIGFGGTASVYKGHILSLPLKEVAIKIPKAKKPYEPLFAKEVTFMQQFHHQYIINLIAYGKGTIVKENLISDEVTYIVMDYASKGDLFDFVGYAGKPFTEDHMRAIFKKILEGVQAMHKAGISHRDLKIENILIDGNYNPKVADFGFSQFSKGKDGKGLLKTKISTPGFTAPEILYGHPYKGELADIFSLGVVMFILIAGKMPFSKINKLDNLFRFIYKEDYDGYWKRLAAKHIQAEFSPEFKDLFQRMVCENPQKRIQSIELILLHPFFKKNYPTQNEILQDFQSREIEIKKKLVIKKEDIEQNTKDAIVYRSGETEIINGFEDSNLCQTFKSKEIPKNSLLITGIVPHRFMNKLIELIEKDETFEKSIKLDEKKMKFRLEVESGIKEDEEEDQDESEEESEGEEADEEKEKEIEIEQLKIDISIKKLDSKPGNYLLLLKKKEGDIIEFCKIREKIIQYVNDKI